MIRRFAPAWVAFHGSEAARAYARQIGALRPGLGAASWPVAQSCAFVLPSASGANRRGPWGGRPTRLEWWSELAALVAGQGG